MKIELKNISKEYRKNVFGVRDINFVINDGITGLVGRNGAGKTTLLRLLALILQPTAGDLYVDDKLIKNNDKEYRECLGYLPQSTRLQPSLTAFEFLEYIAALKGIKDKIIRKNEILRCLEIVGLVNEMNKKLAAFSGGMLRRVGIAQALLGNPKLIIVDEPTAGLDPEERVYFRNLLGSISSDKIIILSTHIITDIESICDSIGILDNGSLIYNGGINTLKNMVKDKVWEYETDKNNERILRDKYRTLSTSYENSKVRIRYVAEKNEEQFANNKEATLEDAYLYLIGGMKRWAVP